MKDHKTRRGRLLYLIGKDKSVASIRDGLEPTKPAKNAFVAKTTGVEWKCQCGWTSDKTPDSNYCPECGGGVWWEPRRDK